MKEQSVNTINEHDQAFRQFLFYAHDGFKKGAEQHGEGSNQKMDLVEEMKCELRDFACYAFFQFKKLEKLQQDLRHFNCGRKK